MKPITLSIVAATLVYLIALPIVFGVANSSSSGGEVLGWSMIFAMFTGVPALMGYSFLFVALFFARLPYQAIIPLSAVGPLAAWFILGVEFSLDSPFLPGTVLGGLAGGIVMTLLKPRELPDDSEIAEEF